jgi:bacterioferritin (cytochrome b1)
MGVKAVAVKDKFKGTAIAEMKHAEKIAERIFYFDVIPNSSNILNAGDTFQPREENVFVLIGIKFYLACN